MSLLELPHTRGCLVCGRENPHGLHLHLHVDPATGQVSTRFTALATHIGFEGIVHGGVLATVLDEAMVWAATWAGRRFCVCAELTVRFKESARVGDELVATAHVDSARPRLVSATGTVSRADGTLLCTATAKYVPLPEDRNRLFVATLIDEPETRPAAMVLRGS